MGSVDGIVYGSVVGIPRAARDFRGQIWAQILWPTSITQGMHKHPLYYFCFNDERAIIVMISIVVCPRTCYLRRTDHVGHQRISAEPHP